MRDLGDMDEEAGASPQSDDVADEDTKGPDLDLLARAVAPLIKRMMKREDDRSPGR